jgi:hypothetical protein
MKGPAASISFDESSAGRATVDKALKPKIGSPNKVRIR